MYNGNLRRRRLQTHDHMRSIGVHLGVSESLLGFPTRVVHGLLICSWLANRFLMVRLDCFSSPFVSLVWHLQFPCGSLMILFSLYPFKVFLMVSCVFVCSWFSGGLQTSYRTRSHWWNKKPNRSHWWGKSPTRNSARRRAGLA